jgi:endonuclease IV
MRTIETTLEHIAHAVADEYRLKCDIKWTQFQNENDEMAVRLIKTVKENQFELMEKTILLGRRFRFIYPTLSRCHVWARIRNRFASFTQS